MPFQTSLSPHQQMTYLENMNDNSKQKVLFLREENADGHGTFVYSKRSKYEGHWKDGQREIGRAHV